MTSTSSPTPHRFIAMQRGDDRPLTFPVAAGGDPVDVTNWAVTAWVWRSEHPGSELLHTWTSSEGTALAEQTDVVLLVDDSRTWGWERGYFEIELTHPDGAVTVEACGVIVLQGRPS